MESISVKILAGVSENMQKLQFALKIYYNTKNTIQKLKGIYFGLTDEEGLEIINEISSGKKIISKKLKSKYPGLQLLESGFNQKIDKEKIGIAGYNTIRSIIEALKNIIEGLTDEDAEIIVSVGIMEVPYPEEILKKYPNLAEKDFSKILKFELDNDYKFRTSFEKISDYVRGIIEKSIIEE